MSGRGLYRIPSLPSTVFERGRVALVLSFVIITLSLASLMTGLAGKRYMYSTVTNLLPLILPYIVRQSTRGSLCTLDLLTIQCFLGVVYTLMILIFDGIVIAFVATEYKYCEGSWREKCAGYEGGSGDIDLVCEGTGYDGRPKDLYVTCHTQGVYVWQYLSLTLNLMQGLLLIPYLLICLSIKLALARYHWENSYLMEMHIQSTAQPMVIIGSKQHVENDEEDLFTGRPVSSKAPNPAYSLDDDTFHSRSNISVTCRSVLPDTSPLK